jgi:hypothetical protein
MFDTMTGIRKAIASEQPQLDERESAQERVVIYGKTNRLY